MRTGLGLYVPHTTADWTPLDLTSLVGWWDASDTATITSSGGAVSQWDDKSGNGNHLVQATSALQPTTGTRTINSLNAIDFIPTDDRMACTTVPNDDLTSTTFGVVLFDSVADHRTIVGSSGSGGQHIYALQTTARLAVAKEDLQAIGDNATTPFTAGVAALFTVAMSASNLLTRVNGGSEENDAHTETFTAGRTLVVGNGVGNYEMDGLIAELFRTSATENGTTIGDAEAYLAAKRGL